MKSVGILGIGSYLPSHVRTNDWWPRKIVDDWGDRMASRATRAEAPDMTSLPLGAQRTMAAMAQYGADPFRGAVERRIMSEDMTPHEMEARAARDAIERAGIDPNEIDVIFSQTPVPENLLVNSACVTHRLLGLSQRCFALQTEVACNAFSQHASLAHAMIASGQARYVLSVHSSAMTRVMRPTEPDSAWMGDGAAAVIFGPVRDGKGILGASHNADGSSSEALVLGVPGKKWWLDGSCTIHAVDRDHTRTMLMSLVDRAAVAVHASIQAAGLEPRNVDFYAAHQGTAWLAKVTKEHVGLERAETLSTFASLGNMSSANVPTVLAMAEREGMIRDGSIVATFTGGIGETWSSLCIRWGR